MVQVHFSIVNFIFSILKSFFQLEVVLMSQSRWAIKLVQWHHVPRCYGQTLKYWQKDFFPFSSFTPSRPLYRGQGKLAEAEQLYQRPLQRYETALGTKVSRLSLPASSQFCKG
jgi:hypothetical protein